MLGLKHFLRGGNEANFQRKSAFQVDFCLIRVPNTRELAYAVFQTGADP